MDDGQGAFIPVWAVLRADTLVGAATLLWLRVRALQFALLEEAEREHLTHVARDAYKVGYAAGYTKGRKGRPA